MFGNDLFLETEGLTVVAGAPLTKGAAEKSISLPAAIAQTFRAAGYETGCSGKWRIFPPEGATLLP